MASSDAKIGRRRTDSSASRSRKSPDQAAQSKSSHTADPFLHDFLSPSFDPATFLNATLPPLGKRQGPSPGAQDPVPLVELSAQAQALLSQLNAQTTRLSNTLTQLTDDILRSGSRLAYEVELLRGETLGLSESLHETLQDDIKQFIPGGLEQEAAATGGLGTQSAAPPGEEAQDPDYIKQLQTLTLVRSRLDSVIKTFGDAMDFTFPPSELSVSSSFLSVSAPEPGSEQQSSKQKGQQVLKQLRDEISELLGAGDDAVQGIEKAASRIEELKELTSVWKGTAEEKGRNRFIEALAKMVEDRHRELLRELEVQAAKKEAKTAPATTKRRRSAEDSRTLPGGFGLMSQLQKLRSGL